MATLKEKFARDRKTLEESFERTRRLNAESALDAMREVRQSESKQVMELMAANQRELGQITSHNADSIKQAKLRLAQEEQEHLDRVVERMDAQVGMKKEKERLTAKAQAVAETERVLERLRDDVMSERRRVKEGIDKELDDLRLSHHASMESKLAQEKRMVERIAAMRGEVESHRSEIRMLEEQRQDKKDVLVDSKNRLSALRTELRQVEDEVDNTELRNNEELNQHQRKCSREYQQLVEEEASTKEAFHREEVACANRRDDAVSMYAADLNRIKDKVGGLLKRKDETARSLRQQLSTLQDKSSELQDALDRVRAEQYSRVTSSVDGGNDSDDNGSDGRGTRDIFQRLNIGNIDPDKGARMNSSSASTTTYSTRGTSATAGASRASRASRTSNRDRDDVSFRV
jgi:chromosome segregation ATPase